MRYLVTGGTGSFGKRYVKRLLERGDQVTVYSRDELKQYEMAKAYPEVRYIIGDIRDEERLRRVMKGHAYVVHAAALKHVRTGEIHPTEAVSTNIIGTWNVAKAAVDAGVVKAVILSTDKAVMPVNTYGATKYAAEKLWLRMNDFAPIFTATRYGNVIGSSGSVLHIFDKQRRNGTFTITDKRMTRFAVTFDYAMQLVDVALMAEAGATVVSKVKAFEIVQLARTFDADAGIEEIGIQAGEKLHEMMLTQYERSRVVEHADHYVLPPDTDGHIPSLCEPLTSENAPRMTDHELMEVVNAYL